MTGGPTESSSASGERGPRNPGFVPHLLREVLARVSRREASGTSGAGSEGDRAMGERRLSGGEARVASVEVE